MKIGLTGRISTRNWEDNDGKKHYVTEVVAENVEFGESKKAQEPTQQPAVSKRAEQQFTPMQEDDEDLPF